MQTKKKTTTTNSYLRCHFKHEAKAIREREDDDEEIPAGPRCDDGEKHESETEPLAT